MVVGGQTLSLALTLLGAPVIDSLFDDASQWWQRRRPKQAMYRGEADLARLETRHEPEPAAAAATRCV